MGKLVRKFGEICASVGVLESNSPSSLFHQTILRHSYLCTMLIEKYIFHLPQAIRFVSKRHGIPHMRPAFIFVLYAVRHLGQAKVPSVVSFAKSVKYEVARSGIAEGCIFLASVGLLDCSDGVYSVSSFGRSFLADIRLFLRYKRLK